MKITSESVLEGHPDKICDQISDAILDEYIRKDPTSRTAIECMISHDLLLVAGEVHSHSKVDIDEVVIRLLEEIGYDSQRKGFNFHQFTLIKNIIQQSSDIARGIEQPSDNSSSNAEEQFGAGDQGTVYGYACDETSSYLPLAIHLAHQLAKKLVDVRKSGHLPYLYPDGKTQVTVEYDEDGKPIRVCDILLSAQHQDGVSQGQLFSDLSHKVVIPVLTENKLRVDDIRILVNPTGRFVIGGPQGDTGLTGRKIVVDTYGGIIPHGGGAFSGKDPSKVDRSAAYMARYVAKNIVAAGLAKRCQLSISYAIGMAEPISVELTSFQTGLLPDHLLLQIVCTMFDFRPKSIIQTLKLLQPIYRQTAVYGHFQSDLQLPWEQIDQVPLLRFIFEQLKRDEEV